MHKKDIKILLTGGGTGGSVAPLLAIVDTLREKEVKFSAGSLASNSFFWLGTKNGLERVMVEKEGIKFKPIFSGKFRRYFSWRNFVDFIFIILGFFQSLFIIFKWKPNLIMSAGSFVSVPAVWAGWILRIPALVHQQDARPGFANKLMAPFARAITVTFEKSLKDYGEKAIWTGNPIRQSFKIKNPRPRQAKRGRQKSKIKNYFNLKNGLPVVLVVGGGTGAMAINKLIEQSLDELTKFCQIIHITGKDKNRSDLVSTQETKSLRFYRAFEFLNTGQIAEACAISDIVVSRCGMGVLTELSYLGKPSILIPIPNSHQEDNAEIFKNNNAAIVLNQKELSSKEFIGSIKNLVSNKELQNNLRNNITKVIKKGANKNIVEIIKNVIKI